MVDKGLSCTMKASYQDFALDASFSVKEGELACIIGPSGCGKSTTLQLIAGLIKPEEGSIILNGKDIINEPVHQRHIAMVFQDYALFPHMSVAQNIAYPMKLRRIPKAKRIAEVKRLLALVSLDGYQKRKSQELSGGERQRVALARALASQPQLLLLDEPLSALDAKLRKHLRTEIRRIHEETGITTLYVTHDQEEALAIADTIIVMQEGRVGQIGSGEDIYHKPDSLFVATFMGEGNTLPYSLISRTFSSQPGMTKEAFKPLEGEHMIFFRPEHVTIQDDRELPLPEFFPHLEFNNAQVESCEFQGDHFRVSLLWEGKPIIAHTLDRPRSAIVRLSVRIAQMREYLNGELVSI
ncbi:MAG: ABC transporter ATP-binding protein [Spirochaetia bacterium]|jgi:ABC-type Fe3+/spermidine/putrescine transport system ATPase subunit|nr:ABC transporter ATP-binding protein [Spirochaetia bacterium]